MKQILIIILFLILRGSLINAADTTALNDSIIPHQHIVVTNTNIPQNKQASAVNINNGDSSNNILDWFMDAIGSTRTIVTWEGIIIIILIIIVYITSIYGIKAIKKVIYIKIGINSEKIQRIEKTIDDVQHVINKVNFCDQNDYSLIQNDIISLKDQLAKFNDVINSQSRYFDQSFNGLFQVVYSIIEHIEDHNQAIRLLDDLYHTYQIACLYRTCSEANTTNEIDQAKLAALIYLEENGTREDIPHLEYIVQHDPNENNRRQAIEVIAIIRSRD